MESTDDEEGSIDIKAEDGVDQLTRAIQATLLKYDQVVSLRDLLLFKTDVPLEPDESLQSRALLWLHQQPTNSQLKQTRRISTVFPSGPHPSDDKLDIIIADTDVLELRDGLGDPNDRYKRKVKKALDERLNGLPPRYSPSDIVKMPKIQAQILGGDKPLIHLGRPGGVPATIFNPALATLQQRLDDLEKVEVDCQEIERAAKYIQRTVEFHEDEAHLQKEIQDLLDQAIGENGSWGCILDWADNIKPDCAWWRQKFLILALELKNTLGLSGDALFQAVIVYSKVVSREQYKRFRGLCNFPIVLLGVTANRLEISVAVCVGPIYVTKLLTLDLSLGFHASDNIMRLARVFHVLASCRKDLRKYYDKVISEPRGVSGLYPSPTTTDPSKVLPKLTYRQFLTRAGQSTCSLVDLGNTTSAMYIATLDDTDEEVIVKFTARYNEVAHRLLADAQLAPKLHFCGRVVGNLFMIVMDRVDGKSIWQLQQDDKPVPAIVSEKVAEAIGILHANGIVFGDLRDPNILHVASKDHVVLVDFDWPGKDGESRYPASLNSANTWAREVEPNGVMRKSHDVAQDVEDSEGSADELDDKENGQEEGGRPAVKRPKKLESLSAKLRNGLHYSQHDVEWSCQFVVICPYVRDETGGQIIQATLHPSEDNITHVFNIEQPGMNPELGDYVSNPKDSNRYSVLGYGNSLVIARTKDDIRDKIPWLLYRRACSDNMSPRHGIQSSMRPVSSQSLCFAAPLAATELQPRIPPREAVVSAIPEAGVRGLEEEGLALGFEAVAERHEELVAGVAFWLPLSVAADPLSLPSALMPNASASRAFLLAIWQSLVHFGADWELIWEPEDKPEDADVRPQLTF
ncbi:hypothetical protein NLJ89_g5539 [Agrocybe chaxingu]|uniref:Protein kinase domain-containing protein n=1 Tax=Agrocybe chaxingu TaxID=84603 RepID=A0A9W8JYA7_9AGAR|nr:hypothetical protein NLJ89_g5539 [Agrocybe chaxingu]